MCDLIQLSFHGAAGTVTGSKYLLTVDDKKILVDCGMFQGRRHLRQMNWNQLPFDPASLDAVVLTHAHIDHIGYLPRLVKGGFAGKVYTTAPTIDLARVSLLDSAHIQEEDAEYRNKKKLTRHEVALPLFTTEDAEAAISMLSPVPFGLWTGIDKDLRFKLHVAGHVLGASSVEIDAQDTSGETRILFSGDIGRYGNPLTSNPAEPPQCDYIVCESTYGGRLHEPEDPYTVFADLINETIDRKSILLIPAFAISRTQQITYLIKDLIRHRRIRPIDIHIDSPMAISVTDIYCKYQTCHQVDLKQLDGPGCVLEGENVFLHRKRKSSKLLNKLKGPAIIMSASGMLTGGRIMHHLINRLPDPSTTVVLAGYMAEGTLGRRLADGAREIYIHKQPINVKAKVVTMHGLSGHADYFELLHWLEPIRQAPRRVFVTHGEITQSEAMAKHLKKERGWECHIPQLNETVEL